MIITSSAVCSLALAASLSYHPLTMATYEYEPNKLLENYKKFKAKLPDSSLPLPPANTAPNNSALIAAAIQLTAVGSPANNVEGFWNRARAAVVNAAQQGATLILLPELFMSPYFCQSQEAALMGIAEDVAVVQENVCIQEFQRIAKQCNVVLPISLFERCNNVFYNTVVMIDADGTNLGIYRECVVVGRGNTMCHVAP